MQKVIGYVDEFFVFIKKKMGKTAAGKALDTICSTIVKTIKTNFFDSIGLGFLFSRKSEKECKSLTSSYVDYELGDLICQPMSSSVLPSIAFIESNP